MSHPGLYQRLVIGAAAFVAVTMAAVGATAWLGVAVLMHQTGERNHLLARAVALSVEAQVATPIQVLEDLVADLEVGGYQASQAPLATITRAGERSPMITALELTDTAGRVVTTSPADPRRQGLDLASLPWFAALAGAGPQTVSGDVEHSATGEGLQLLLARAWPGGVALAHLDLADFTALAAIGRAGPGSFVAILDRTGRALAHSEAEIASRRTSFRHLGDPSPAADGATRRWFRTRHEGASVLVSTAPIQTLGWTVLVAQDVESAVGVLHRSAIGLLSSLGAGLLAILVALAYLVGRFLAPLRALSRQAREVADGASTVAVEPRFRELVELVGSFNRMATAVARREQDLRRSQARFAAFMDHLPGPAWILDRHHHLLAANPPARRMVPEVGTGPVWAWLAEQVTAVTEADAARRSELAHADRVYEAVAFAIGGDEPMTAVAVTALDVSEQRALAERLRQSEKMEAIGQLAGGIAHDFNNQLGGILGYADLLRKRITDERLERWAQAIVAAAERSAELTRQLLAFARKGQAEYRPVDCHRLIEEVIGICAHSFDRRIEIVRDLGAASALVSGEGSQLQAALLNLALNARDAMPDGGTLTFASRLVTSTRSQALAAGTYLLLSVTDTGVGMEETVLARVFEPFFTTKRAGHGTGLGLAAVFGTAERHGGRVTVESTPGQGSRFELWLPLCQEAETRVTEVARRDGRRGRGHILVVDDEGALRELAEEVLTEAGYRVTTAADGQAAVECYQRAGDLDLVLLDMVMPGMDGRATWTALKRLDPAVRVVLTSGYNLEEDRRRLLEGGLVALLDKPYTVDDLVATVDQALDP